MMTECIRLVACLINARDIERTYSRGSTVDNTAKVDHAMATLVNAGRKEAVLPMPDDPIVQQASSNRGVRKSTPHLPCAKSKY